MSACLNYKAHLGRYMVGVVWTSHGPYSRWLDSPCWQRHILFFEI